MELGLRFFSLLCYGLESLRKITPYLGFLFALLEFMVGIPNLLHALEVPLAFGMHLVQGIWVGYNPTAFCIAEKNSSMVTLSQLLIEVQGGTACLYTQAK